MKCKIDLHDLDSSTYKIKGQKQERSSAISKLLNSVSFRNELVEFLLKHWSDPENDISFVLNDKRIFLLYGKDCYLFSRDHDKKKQIRTFENNHIEVESRIMMIVAKILHGNNILIRTQNIEAVLVYILYHMQNMTEPNLIWIENFKSSKKPSDTINVQQIYSKLDRSIINSLPAWYMFSGYFYEPSFFNKGKKTNFKILEKHNNIQQAFAELGLSPMVSEQNAKHLEKYTCLVYNSKKDEVNAVRAEIFENAYKPKKNVLNFKDNGILISIILLFVLFKLTFCFASNYNEFVITKSQGLVMDTF